MSKFKILDIGENTFAVFDRGGAVHGVCGKQYVNTETLRARFEARKEALGLAPTVSDDLYDFGLTESEHDQLCEHLQLHSQ